jgi:hypothetical protein
VVKGIEFMIGDALMLGDKVLGITNIIKERKHNEYVNLTDCVSILRSRAASPNCSGESMSCKYFHKGLPFQDTKGN